MTNKSKNLIVAIALSFFFQMNNTFSISENSSKILELLKKGACPCFSADSYVIPCLTGKNRCLKNISQFCNFQKGCSSSLENRPKSTLCPHCGENNCFIRSAVTEQNLIIADLHCPEYSIQDLRTLRNYNNSAIKMAISENTDLEIIIIDKLNSDEQKILKDNGFIEHSDKPGVWYKK
jgi:hypothetical protein